MLEVLLEKQESPSGFLESYQKTYGEFTPFDLYASESQQDVTTAFVTQLSPDVYTRLQKLETLEEMEAFLTEFVQTLLTRETQT